MIMKFGGRPARSSAACAAVAIAAFGPQIANSASSGRDMPKFLGLLLAMAGFLLLDAD